MNYRAVNRLKNYMVRYFTGIFMAAEKGQLLLTDGENKIQWSRQPDVMRRGSWDFRKLPAVLIGAARGNFKTLSVAKDHIYTSGAMDDIDKQWIYEGGDLHLTLDLDVRATTMDERDNLTDVVGVMLAGSTCKEFFAQFDIMIANPPTIGGEKEVREPNLDHPIYSTAISIDTVSSWRIKSALPERLIYIIIDITPEME